MAQQQPTINCLWGTPYQDPATGEWRCPSDLTQTQQTAPVPPLVGISPKIRYPFSGFPQTVNYNYNFPLGTVNPTQQLAAGGSSPTIFGMSPLVALGVGVAALWALSSMDGKSK